MGFVRPTTMRIVVDLPAPLGPRKPVTRPGRATKLTPSTTVVRPYFLVSESMVIMGFLRDLRVVFWGHLRR